MQEMAALLLCKIAGKSGTAEEITSVVTAGGGEVNEEAIKTLAEEMEGKDVNELLGAGMEKLSTVVMGGGGGGGGGGGDAGGDGAAAEEVEEEKVEEEEMDLGGGMDMFGAEEGSGDY